MKKRTDEEKLQALNNACDLIIEGIDAIRRAEKMLHLCGIYICDYINVSDIAEWERNGNNVQIYRGIPKMESIIGARAYHPLDFITEKPDRSRKILKYKGLVFLQTASKSESKFSYR